MSPVSRAFFVIAAAALLVLGWGSVAQAGPQPMVGSWTVINPSVPNTFARQVLVGAGPSSFGTVTTTGRTISVPVSQFFISGANFRNFPGLGLVAQASGVYTTFQRAAVFKSGSGAAAGGPISFCPKVGAPAGSPPYQVGNTACTDFNAAGSGNQPIRIGIHNQPAAPNFGGVLQMLQNAVGVVWFMPVPPTPSNPTGIASKYPNDNTAGQCPVSNPDCNAWGLGMTAYRFFTGFHSKGPNYGVLLTPTSGEISTIVSSLGTPTGTIPNNSAVGFPFTTGTVSGSDIYPPNNPPTSPSFFFFSRAGTDTRATTTGGAVTGNIVMVGGSLATSPAGAAGNLFYNIGILKMRVPEPGMGLSLTVGVLGLIGLARLRSRS